MDCPGHVPGPAITAAIPPVFDAYATIVLPDNGEDQERHNRAMLALLEGEPARQQWWLGYLSGGAGHLAFPGAAMAALPKVTLYAEWEYVLVQAGPGQAATWRRNRSLWWRDVDSWPTPTFKHGQYSSLRTPPRQVTRHSDPAPFQVAAGPP